MKKYEFKSGFMKNTAKHIGVYKMEIDYEKEHEAMWYYIISKLKKSIYRREIIEHIKCIKEEYLKERGINSILNNCFACEECNGICKKCKVRPIIGECTHYYPNNVHFDLNMAIYEYNSNIKKNITNNELEEIIITKSNTIKNAWNNPKER